MTVAAYMICMGVFFFLVFGLESCVKIVANASVKKAEANARAEEARAERAKTELELARLEHNMR